MRQQAFIALGSNLEQPVQQVQQALQALATLPESRLLAHSSLYVTAPVGYDDQPDFINAVAWIETEYSAPHLLAKLFEIEDQFGRARSFRNAPRILDLDLLLYSDIVLNSPELIVPHPRLHERAFVLVPLAEIAPDIVIPHQGRVSDCLAKIDLDSAHIRRLDEVASPIS